MTNQFTFTGWRFVASGLAVRLKAKLYNMKPTQDSPSLSWDGRREGMTTTPVSLPVTDVNFWEGRFALTRITIERPDGEKLEINDATVSISRKKNIVTTELVGLDGTIKEYISNGDYEVRINVGIVAVDGDKIIDEYPTEGIEYVRGFLEVNDSLEIHSPFLELFDIDRIVVTEFSVDQNTASNRQTIDIKALSDQDYEIECTEY